MLDVAVRNLLFDSAEGLDIMNEDKKLSKKEVDAKIAELCFQFTGLTKDSTDKQIKRALESDGAKEFFAVIEEVIEKKISTGMKEVEFFNEYVEEINLAEGDKNDFWAKEDIILQIERVSGSHHDLVQQKLNEGQPYTVPTAYYGCKVGQDIKLFLLGRKSWSEFVDAIPKAYIKMLQDMIYTEFTNAASTLPLPAEFQGTGALDPDSKDDFDELIENVEMSNNNVAVVVMGTKTALKKINGIVTGTNAINWMADSQKESIAHTGILGDYEGTVLLEIPQRFADNDTTRKLIDNTKLYIMPLVDDNKFIKYINGGETTLEVTEVGATMNDQQSYEVQRKIGVGTLLTRNFGIWTITND